MKKRAVYLVKKFSGNIDFALKVQSTKVDLAKTEDAMLIEAEVFQELEVIKANKNRINHF